jgi:hypothetical protein
MIQSKLQLFPLETGQRDCVRHQQVGYTPRAANELDWGMLAKITGVSSALPVLAVVTVGEAPSSKHVGCLHRLSG